MSLFRFPIVFIGGTDNGVDFLIEAVPDDLFFFSEGFFSPADLTGGTNNRAVVVLVRTFQFNTLPLLLLGGSLYIDIVSLTLSVNGHTHFKINYKFNPKTLTLTLLALP